MLRVLFVQLILLANSWIRRYSMLMSTSQNDECNIVLNFQQWFRIWLGADQATAIIWTNGRSYAVIGCYWHPLTCLYPYNSVEFLLSDLIYSGANWIQLEYLQCNQSERGEGQVYFYYYFLMYLIDMLLCSNTYQCRYCLFTDLTHTKSIILCTSSSRHSLSYGIFYPNSNDNMCKILPHYFNMYCMKHMQIVGQLIRIAVHLYCKCTRNLYNR